MVESAVGVRETWRGVLDALGIADDASIIIGGTSAPSIARWIPLPLVDESANLVSMGSGPELGVDARPDATDIADGSVDAALMLGSWGDTGYLHRVARECHRILGSGGVALLGRLATDRLAGSSPARYRGAMVNAMHDGGSSAGGATIELALVRARLRRLSIIDVDLPVAIIGDVDAYIEAVCVGGLWPGVESIAADDLDGLVAAIRGSLTHEEFPLVEYQPWRFVRGVRPP
jgi:hypothetical protein